MKEILLPVFAMTALFVIPAIIGLIAIVFWFKSRNRLYQSIDDAIERGASPEVIRELIVLTESREQKEEKKPAIKHLCDGAVLFALGIAFLAFYHRGGPHGVIFPGIFLTLFGLAKFGIAAIISKSDKKDRE